ncbi:MAG: hypothetical protein LBE79_09000 [Tannerella sp.]|jgi:hypothetical protein|nr:hypothetical protein [Tannerella sp.]
MKTKCLIFLLFLCTTTVFAQNRYFVNQTTGNDSNDGKSWSKAFVTLQRALDEVSTGDEIWVATGIYLPSKTIAEVDEEGNPLSERYATFLIPNGVKLFGGFPVQANNNTGMNGRNWEIHRTILSGDLNQDDGDDFTNMEDNTYRVVLLYNTDESTLIDGFTITAGNADYPVLPGMLQGSGICAISNGPVSNPALKNLIIEGNVSRGGGAGFSNYTTQAACPMISNTIFRNNKSGEYGGGFANYGTKKSSPILENVIISGNQAFNGGGMYCLSESTETSPVFFNVLVHGNLAENRAGGIYLHSYQGNVKPMITNTTISGNKAGARGIGNGGGLYCIADVAISSPEIRNTVIWDNKAIEYNDFHNIGAQGSNPDIQFSLISDRVAFPQYRLYYPFIDAINPDLAPTTAGNYQPRPKEVLIINKGSNTFVPATMTADLAGKPRIFDQTVDIGAFECQEKSTTGILETNVEKNIWAEGGNLYVRIVRPATVRIFSVDGILVQQVNLPAGTKAISLPAGLYFVSLNNETATKVYILK